MKAIDLTGKTFGKLTVIKRIENNKHGNSVWNCLCECGKTKNIEGNSLTKSKKATKSCGCKGRINPEEFIGKKFNHLTILKYIGKNDTNNGVYEAECVCGKKIKVLGYKLKANKAKSCGCRRNEKLLVRFEKDAAFSVKNIIYNSYKYGAKDRNFNFDLSKEQFFELIIKNCYYCDTPPSNTKEIKTQTYGNHSFKFNGVDRKNSNLGYTIENSVSCCKTCNIAKNNLTEDVFLEWVKKIYTYQSIKEREK